MKARPHLLTTDSSEKTTGPEEPRNTEMQEKNPVVVKDVSGHVLKGKHQSPPKRGKSESQKEELKAEVIAEMESQALKIAKRNPTRGLLLKQRKLLTAAKFDNFQLVKSSGFIYFEPDVNAKDDRQNTALYYAAKNGNMEFCQFLVDHGANPNYPCENGNTPLHMAFQSDKEAVINFFLLISF